MYRLAAALHASVPMTVGAESKADRGWRLRTGRPREAVKHAGSDLAGDVTAAEAFRRIMDGALAHLMANYPAAAGGEVEGRPSNSRGHPPLACRADIVPAPA